MKTGTDIWTV